MRQAAETLRLDYAQFLELEIFTRFGGVTDAQVKDKIARGRRIRAVLSQPQLAPLRLADEVALIFALQTGLLDRIPLDKIGEFRSALSAWLDTSMPAFANRVERSESLDEASRFQLRRGLTALAERLAPEPNPSQLGLA